MCNLYRQRSGPQAILHAANAMRSTVGNLAPGDFYPDYQMRLYDRRHARWNGRYVHESVAVDGPAGRLRNDLQHYSYSGLADQLGRINHYTTLAARQMHEDGRRAGLLQLAGHPPLAFLRNYLAHGGIGDGLPGFIISALNAYYVFLKFAKLWEAQRTQKSQVSSLNAQGH